MSRQAEDFAIRKDMENSKRYEPVTKLDAAQRQLAVAIRMFFERKDMIAVHTVTTASQQILLDLAKPLDIKSIFEHERLQELREVFRNSQNFLKHADRDPNARLPFFPEATKFHLFDAALLATRLTDRMLPEAAAFLGWFMKEFPYLFDVTNAPEVAAALEFVKGQNFDNFELVLISIDQLSRKDLRN
jgi:hypothetical protein